MNEFDGSDELMMPPGFLDEGDMDVGPLSMGKVHAAVFHSTGPRGDTRTLVVRTWDEPESPCPIGCLGCNRQPSGSGAVCVQGVNGRVELSPGQADWFSPDDYGKVV